MKKFATLALAATALTAALPASQASAATFVVNVAGAQSFSSFGSASNFVQTYNLGAGAVITGVSYTVNITAFDPSYLSEAVLAFTDNDATDGVFLTPGIGFDDPGTSTFTGSADLVALDLDFVLGADGLLRLEYFEDFDDSSVSPDAIWNSGTFTFTYTPVAGVVPEPASWALMIGGFGMVGGAMRRRRQVRVSYAA